MAGRLLRAWYKARIAWRRLPCLFRGHDYLEQRSEGRNWQTHRFADLCRSGECAWDDFFVKRSWCKRCGKVGSASFHLRLPRDEELRDVAV